MLVTAAQNKLDATSPQSLIAKINCSNYVPSFVLFSRYKLSLLVLEHLPSKLSPAASLQISSDLALPSLFSVVCIAYFSFLSSFSVYTPSVLPYVCVSDVV